MRGAESTSIASQPARKGKGRRPELATSRRRRHHQWSRSVVVVVVAVVIVVAVAVAVGRWSVVGLVGVWGVRTHWKGQTPTGQHVKMLPSSCVGMPSSPLLFAWHAEESQLGENSQDSQETERGGTHSLEGADTELLGASTGR